MTDESHVQHDTKLSPTDRTELAQIARRLGIQRAARELGVSRTSYGALVIGTAMPLVEAQAARALPRLRAELAGHDADGGGHAAYRVTQTVYGVPITEEVRAAIRTLDAALAIAHRASSGLTMGGLIGTIRERMAKVESDA